MLGKSLKYKVLEETGRGEIQWSDGGVSLRVSCCYPIEHLSPNQTLGGCSTTRTHSLVNRGQARLRSPSPLDWALLGSEQSVQNAAFLALERRQNGTFSEMKKKGKMSSLQHSGSEQGLWSHYMVLNPGLLAVRLWLSSLISLFLGFSIYEMGEMILPTSKVCSKN